MSEEKTADIKQPQLVSPFTDAAWSTLPPTIPEPLTGEEADKPKATDTDPVIADKDLDIKKDKPTSDKPDEPLKIPSATPPPVQDLPDDKKKLDEEKAEFKFANETSEKIFDLLKNGKEDEVLEFLSKKQTLKNIDKLPHADIIKLQLKNENKDYTSEDIEDLFNEKYSLPEKPEQAIDETDEEFAEKETKHKEQLAKINRRIERDAKNSKTELLKLQQELVLPDIPQKNPELQQLTQEELGKVKKQQEQFLQAVEGSLSKLNGYNATFKDEEVEIPIAYKVAAKEKDELKPLLDSLNTDLPQFFQQLDWVDKDGNLNTDKVVHDLHLLKNKDDVIQKFVNEAGNKRYKEAIKSQKNIDFNGHQRRGNLEPNLKEEVDKNVNAFFQAS